MHYLEQDTPPSSTCKIPEKHVLGGYLLQRLTDHRHPKSCRYKGERASGAVRFLDDPRLETHPAASIRTNPKRCARRGFRCLRRRPPGGKVQPRQGVPEEWSHCWYVRRRRANDAPALRQAQMGIAVSTATDVAKSAAGIVLTKPGLGGIVASVKEGRVTFQRILTYKLNSVTKKTVQVLFLAVGLVMTGHAILTPMLMVIIMLTGDLLGMSLTTDNVRPSPMSNAWRIGELTIAGVFMGISELVFCTAVLAIAKFRLGFGIETLRTLAFVVIVFGNQATTYPNRERQRLGSPRPSLWLIGSSVVDLLIASTLATSGIAMAPLPIFAVEGTLVAAAVFALSLDFAKVPVFKRLRIA